LTRIAASKHHDIIITDPKLTEHGFTKFSLPFNGNATAAVMVVHNTDKSKMMYPPFYKADLDKTVQSLRDKIVSDGILIDDDTADGLVAYFRNAGILLLEDPDSIFLRMVVVVVLVLVAAQQLLLVVRKAVMENQKSHNKHRK
jgi:hypothetical protein